MAPRQAWQTPVSGWHNSACPLQAQGRQHGKPHRPERQWSQRPPARPARHVHCPLTGLQMVPVAPLVWQWHSVGNYRAIRERRWLVPDPTPILTGPEAICSRHAVVTGWQEKEQDKVNLTVLSATTVLQPPQARGTHSPRPPPWSRVEMLQTRRAQTSGTVLGRPVLAAPMQPALRSSCTCPGAPDRSASDSFTAARAQSSRRMEGGRQRAVSPAPLTKPNYPSLQWVSQPLPAPFLVLF